MLHGIVTWGLSTVATFAIVASLFSGVAGSSVALLRTVTVAVATAPPAAQNEASRAEQGPANVLQQAPTAAPTVTIDLSIISLVVFGGILAAALASLIGGAIGRSEQIVGATEQRV